MLLDMAHGVAAVLLCMSPLSLPWVLFFVEVI
jgi:hypothetical protein